MNEFIERDFLQGADVCTVCQTQLTDFRKFHSGHRWHWSGWCDKCQKDRVTVTGNNENNAEYDYKEEQKELFKLYAEEKISSYNLPKGTHECIKHLIKCVILDTSQRIRKIYGV